MHQLDLNRRMFKFVPKTEWSMLNIEWENHPDSDGNTGLL